MKSLLPLLLLGLVGAPSFALDFAPSKEKPPEPMREFRGAWIATVHNIDWPSRRGLSGAQQRAEMVQLLDLAAQSGLNAVILQVRTECDALYRSSIEPWSYWLSGRMGVGPSDGYDPLQFATKEAHKRGLEMHAWFNPFRASASESSIKTSNHITKRHSGAILSSGTQKWVNPGTDLARQRAIQVMNDVTRRYDIDAIHIDDYFYPYPKFVNKVAYDQFDDSRTYQRYRSGGGRLSLKDWRRSQIDRFVSEMYTSTKAIKPWVKVGISPFGIWKPGIPRTTEARLDAYDHLAADSRKWLQQGWVDYFSPQLYWRIDPPEQSFRTLVEWWNGQNSKKRHLWPGIASSRVMSKEDPGRPASEMLRQIDLTRKHRSPMGPGHLHWSIKALKENKGGLRNALPQSYQQPALVPASPWLGSATPSPVYLSPSVEGGSIRLDFQAGAQQARWKLVQVKEGRSWRTLPLIRAEQQNLLLPGQPSAFSVRHVSPTGALSVPTVLQVR